MGNVESTVELAPSLRASIASEANYVLLTFVKSKSVMTAELKSLEGKVLDRTETAIQKGK